MNISPLVVPPMKVDISIKHRKSMQFNVRHQYENPRGQEFEIPEKCVALHSSANTKFRFRCCDLSREDVISFRDSIYQTSEKHEQNEVLKDYIEITDTKANKGTGIVSRLKQVYYRVPNLHGIEIPVCINMFYEVTGMGKTRIANLTKKIYKMNLLKNGSKLFNKIQLPHKLAKKEKILQMETGSLAGIGMNTTTTTSKSGDEELVYFLDSERDETECTNGATKVEDLFEVFEDDITQEEKDIEKLEVCRICSDYKEVLYTMFEPIEESDAYSAAEMLEIVFSMKIVEDDNLSNYICELCSSRLKQSFLLKIDLNNMQLSMARQESNNFGMTGTKSEDNTDSISCIEELMNDEEQDESCKYEEKTLFIEPVEELSQFNEGNFMEDTEMIDNDSEYVLEQEDGDTVNPNVEKRKRTKVYSDITKPKKCHLCVKDFENCTPEEHFQTFHNYIRTEKCAKCEFMTEFPWFMNLHLQVHAENFKKCPVCEKIISKENNKFAVHKGRCGKLKPNVVYKCQFCEHTSGRIYDLKIHERKAHTRETPYQCEICNEEFLSRMLLRRHQLKHGGIGAGCHCPNCSRPFLQKYELFRHLRNCLKKAGISESSKDSVIHHSP